MKIVEKKMKQNVINTFSKLLFKNVYSLILLEFQAI